MFNISYVLYYIFLSFGLGKKKKKEKNILHYLFMLIEEESAGESLFVKL